MSNEEEKRCPLCAEEMDWTDQQLKPCKCGYQVCVWCWHHIMEMAEKYETEGKCPACRTPYDKERVVGTEAKFERVVTNNSNRKHKPPKAKPKTSEGRKDLTNVRVIQRKIAYVIGLPLSLADEDLLQRKEYFGQYGKVSKVSLSRTAGGAVQQFVNDTCSVYITYLKEEEAVRCIQSVHGFVLEGSFLRASFGTAKYCHAWLRNTPCNNPACLYLHSVGAEEDSFGKDEVAAVHTRSRVQQIVGDTHNLQRRSGNVLPPPVDEQHFTNSCASNDNPTVPSDPKDFSLATVNSSGHLTNLSSFKDKDGSVRAFNKMTTFVDIVGRSCSFGSEKGGNVSEDRRILNLCSELSSLSVDGDSHIEAGPSDSVLCKVSSSNHLVNEFPVNKEFNEPFRESSNLLALRADIEPIDSSVTKEQSYATLDSGRLELHGPCNPVREDLLSFDDQRLRDFDSLSQTASLLPSSSPAMIPEDYSDQAWQHRESRTLNDYNLDRNTVNNFVDEASIQFTHVNSISNEGYNERKFQSSSKSDRIYRCSNLFSNEEIVEHLRRLDDDDMTNDDENPALDAVKSSIISNLMSLDFDACDESSTLPHNYTGLFDETDGQHGSSWNFHNSDQSGFSFAKQEGSASQLTDLRSSFSNIGQESRKCSVFQDSGEIKEHYLCKPQYHVSRAQCLTPPGFSLPSREPPPGFPACDRTDQVVRAMSGNHLVKCSLPNNHYRTPSTGNSSNTSDVDLIDPAILVASRGKPTNGSSNSCLDVGSGYASSRPSSFEDEARLWLLMQQSTAAHQAPKFPQTYMQQTPPAHQEQRHSGRIGDGFSSWDDIYGISSRLVDQHQAYNPSSFTQFSQPNFANGHFSNGYHQPSFDEVQRRSEVSMAEAQINGRLGFNKFLPGYGDYMLQMPSSGDVYTRVFGM